MLKYKSVLQVVVLFGLLSPIWGCVKVPTAESKPMFEVEHLDACLAVVVDMSDSYRDDWETRAHALLLDLMQRFFSESRGSRSKIVLAQLSDADQVVLFEGTPADLQARFRTPRQLGDYLRAHSESGSSKVFHAVSEITTHLVSDSQISAETQLLTVMLTDGINTRSRAVENRDLEQEMHRALVRYREKQGAFAMYFVAESQTTFWKQTLNNAGFEPGTFIVEDARVASPQLPSF